ncbi:MAG TPA: hypothetical protein VF986_08845 [Actinomycetota bacterium]
MLALARVEGRRLLRHPIVFGSIPFCAGTFALVTWNQAPVLSRDDILTGLALCPLAGAVFLAAHLGATRSFRHGTDELYESAVTTSAQRTAGHLLSVLWATGLAILLVVAAMLYLVGLHPVARPDPVELLTGPFLVVLGGVLGVALARWWRAALAGPVGVVALAAVEIMLVWQTSAGRPENDPNPVRWLALWVPIAVSGDPPRELVVRPSAWHLVFIASLTLLAGGVALLRAGVRPHRVAVTAGALSLLVVAASAQVRAPTAAQRTRLADFLVHPERYQVCQTRLGVRYCAYRAYAGWIDRWAAAVTPVINRVPAPVRPKGVEIIQTLVVYGSDVGEAELQGSPAAAQFGYNPTEDDLGSAITPGNQWGRGRYEGRDELAMDLIVAAQAVGLPRRPQDVRLTASEARGILAGYDPSERADAAKQIHAGGAWGYCTSLGQARAVVALWLAAQATSRTEAAFRAVLVGDPYRITVVGTGADTDIRSGIDELNVFGGPMLGELEGLPYQLQIFNFVVQWGKAEAFYAEQLLDRPPAEVSEALTKNWELLTRPSNTTNQLVQLMALRPLPSYEEQLQRAGVAPDRIRNIIHNQTDPANADPSLVPCR